MSATKLNVLRVFEFLALLITLTKYVEADCRKTFIYHPKYNYGYDIFCTRTTSVELSTTMANNGITLTILNSNLTITNATFKYLKNIRTLNITNSEIAFENVKNQENVLSLLENLENLIIQHTQIKPSLENSYLQGLPKLKVLNLDSNNIKSFENGTFKDLTNLKTLHLRNNHITSFRNLSLCNLTSLRELDLSNNSLGHLNNGDLKCLQQLEKLIIDGNYVKKLDAISSMSLNTLSLKGNQIDSIGKIDVPNLTTLDLSANKLMNITKNDFKELNNLIRFNLAHNNLTQVYLSTKILKYLDLSHNNLTEIPTFELIYLKSLNLSFNNISVINQTNFSLFHQLETLEFSNNKINYIQSNSFINLPKLRVLDLSQNLLKNISLSFIKNSTLSLLNISHNAIDEVTPSCFANLGQLKHLDFSFNKIKVLNESTFGKLENLETLNMSNNILTELDYKLVEPLENLVILDVDANQITELDYSSIVNELPNLDAFKAKNNLLTCEFLTRMIHYFKDNEITFSLNEHLDFDKENVEGIYCKETEHKLQSLEKTEEALVKNTQMLNEMYSKFATSSGDKKSNFSLTRGEIIACVLSLICLVIVITLAVQKALVWHRRRSYLVDELELISNEPYKRLGH